MAAKKRSAPQVQQKEMECLPRIADGLFGWQFMRWIQGRDVLIWRDPVDSDPRSSPSGLHALPHIRVSFMAPALAIERNVYAREMIPNPKLSLDISLQRALGFDAKLNAGGYDIDSELGRELDEPDSTYDSLLHAIETYVAHALKPCMGLTVVSVNFIPIGGEPTQVYYSAKKRAWQPAGAPPAHVELEISEDVHIGSGSRQVTHRARGADLCRVYPRIGGCWPELLAVPSNANPTEKTVFGAKRNGSFMVMHATMPLPASRKAIKACGGWLFSSLGVGLVPSVTFGPLCLFASVGIVLSGLRPYRKGRGIWPVTIYNTDSWTMSSRHFPMASVRLYRQLTGTFDEGAAEGYGAVDGYGAHQWILGAPTSTSTFGSEAEVKQLESTRSLATELAKRWDVWGWGGKPKDIEDVQAKYGNTSHRYPYLEAKSNGIIDASCWQLAVCPRSWAKESRAYMRETGIVAPLLVLDDPPTTARVHTNGFVWHWPHHGDDDETYAYSRAVAEAAAGYAHRNGRVREYHT